MRDYSVMMHIINFGTKKHSEKSIKNSYMRKVEIEIPDGKIAKWVNGVLTLVDEKPQNVMERIKTFEDAVAELSNRAMSGDKDAGKLLDEWKIITSTADSKDLLAYLKLRIITSALNEGWEPKFIQREDRWAPYFLFYTKEEIENMNAETMARVVLLSDKYANANAYGGVSVANSHYASSIVNASYGSRLAFKSKELAKYAGKQFIKIYTDFIFKAEELNK